MSVLVESAFVDKANSFKRPLKHTKIAPVNLVQIAQDPSAFQGLRATAVSACQLPLVLNSGESVILDFGDHCVGQLHYEITHLATAQITDSPVKFRFTFGEFPLEIVTPPESYKGTIGSGWLQNETKAIVFTPYSGILERRYAFRYLKIERLDSALFPVAIVDLYADTVSAVSLEAVAPLCLEDPMLEKIYTMSLKTLKECEQDVFEDGPKRDRRLWIGDLRLQAMSDFLTFENKELVKRCIYLFAAYRNADGFVAPYVFPDSPPCVDNWVFVDYSLFFISCLYDYTMQYGDMDFLKELYPIALEQVDLCMKEFNFETGELNLAEFDFKTGELTGKPAHIEWCNGLDKGLAATCVMIYAMKQLVQLMGILGMDTSDICEKISGVTTAVLEKHTCEKDLYRTKGGQISWASQIWLVLADILPMEENIRILEALERENPAFGIHTPYLMHYYIDALYSCGRKEKAMAEIKAFWGQLVEFGFDCCPEIFNPENHFDSPYKAPELNSACHAWSCTPIYWIHRYLDENKQ